MSLFNIVLIKLMIRLIILFEYTVFIFFILEMLISFGVISQNNKFVLRIYMFLKSNINPILMKFRKLVPLTIGMVDLSPIVLFMLLGFIKDILIRLIAL